MIYLILFFYCYVSFYHFYKVLGDKFHKDTLIDYVLYPPIYIIITFFVGIKLIIDKIKRFF